MKLSINAFDLLKFDIAFLQDVIDNYHEYFFDDDLCKIEKTWEITSDAKEISLYNHTTNVRFIMELTSDVVYCIYRVFNTNTNKYDCDYVELSKNNHVNEIDKIFNDRITIR